jgi:hypothetical protein
MKVATIAITGTKKGATDIQLATARRIITSLSPDSMVHGDCVGADTQAHGIGRELGLFMIGRPGHGANPKINTTRAFSTFDKLYPAEPYLKRDKKIAEDGVALVAMPDGPERQRSGTWATVRYADKLDKQIVIIYPDGTIEQRNSIPKGKATISSSDDGRSLPGC